MAGHRETCKGTFEMECCCPPHLCTREYRLENCDADQFWEQVQELKGQIQSGLGPVTWWEVIDLDHDGWIVIFQYECEQEVAA